MADAANWLGWKVLVSCVAVCFFSRLPNVPKRPGSPSYSIEGFLQIFELKTNPVFAPRKNLDEIVLPIRRPGLLQYVFLTTNAYRFGLRLCE